MTVTTSIEQSLTNWEKMMKEDMNPDFNLKEAEEVSLDNTKFPDNTFTQSDWKQLLAQSPHCKAFSATECGLTSIEAPETDLELEVLDFGGNPLSDISFVKKFPKMVSFSMGGDNKIASLDDLKVLKDLPALQILELESVTNFGLGEEDEFVQKVHDYVFEMLPDLISLNGLDMDGEEVIMGSDGMEEEDYLDYGLEEEDFEELEEEDIDDFDEGDFEEGEEGAKAEEGGKEEGAEAGSDEEEPAAKRQKTE